jgi:Uncharacterized conserved protein
VPAGLDRCAALGAQRIVVLPYFLFSGVLPDRVVAQAEAWAEGRPDTPVICADVLGDTDALADLVIERYDEALAGDIRMACDTCVYRVAMPGFATGWARRSCRTTTPTIPSVTITTTDRPRPRSQLNGPPRAGRPL